VVVTPCQLDQPGCWQAVLLQHGVVGDAAAARQALRSSAAENGIPVAVTLFDMTG
jgi:hypothetical protein